MIIKYATENPRNWKPKGEYVISVPSHLLNHFLYPGNARHGSGAAPPPFYLTLEAIQKTQALFDDGGRGGPKPKLRFGCTQNRGESCGRRDKRFWEWNFAASCFIECALDSLPIYFISKNYTCEQTEFKFKKFQLSCNNKSFYLKKKVFYSVGICEKRKKYL